MNTARILADSCVVPDYPLTNLSSRSFEHLIQAIALKVFGPSLSAFGDGPDGGREATANGSFGYPSRSDPWDGYLVVQAKFRQRLTSTSNDGTWALAQLKDELEAYCKPASGRRTPEYYVFATNVVLTPAPQTGFKDRALALIDTYHSRLDLKGCAIWDYDQLRAYLDNYQDIRTAYSAWLTPGDVFAALAELLEGPNFETTLANYLQKELISNHYLGLEEAGYTGDDRIPLARVFVDLPTTHTPQVDADVLVEPEISHFVNYAVGRGSDRLPAGGSSSTRALGRIALVGGPGQGKTTLGQFLCQVFRASLLATRDPDLLAPEALPVLSDVQLRCERLNIPQPGGRRFPVHVVLSEFAETLAIDDTVSLLAFLASRIAARTSTEVTPSQLRSWLGRYPWLIVLDGLDEVPASSNRHDLLRAIREFWVDASSVGGDVLVIGTTRPQGYSDDFDPSLYEHRWLLPLDRDEALNYGRLLADVRYPGDLDRQAKVLGRLERAAAEEATRRLMESPLQVTIMSVLVDRMGEPPHERWTLFREYYNVIYQREVERGVPAARVLRSMRPDIDAIHNMVGLTLQIESERTGSTDARLTNERFAQIVETRLRDEGHEGADLVALRDEIAVAATQRLVFLVGPRENAVGFEIRSLQEFMAAEALMEGDEHLIRQRLYRIAPLASWRNVLLFAVGKAFATRQHLRDVIYALTAQLNEDDDPVIRLPLAGSELAIDVLADGPTRNQPKYSRLFARLGLRLLDLPPADIHSRLAATYEPQLEETFRQELAARLSGSESSVAAWYVVSRLIDSGIAWAEALAESEWNATTGRRILPLFGASAPNSWLEARLAETIVLEDGSSVVKTLASPPFGLHIHDVAASDPNWVTELRQLPNGERYENRIAVRLSLEPEQAQPESQGGFSVLLLGTPVANPRRSALLDIPNRSGAWQSYQAGLAFTAQPSRRTLADALRASAEDDLSRSPHLGWPLLACLNHYLTLEDRADAAERAEAGAFGDTDDWVAAEERFQRQGITAEDITYASSEEHPFDQSIGVRGFPFRASGWRVSFELEAVHLIEGLLHLYSEMPTSPRRARLAEWVLVILSHHDDRSRPLPDDSLLRSLCVDAAERSGRFVAEVVALPGVEDRISEPEWLETLDRIGQTIEPVPYRFGRQLAPLLTPLIANHPDHLGLVRFLALLGTDETTHFRIPPRVMELLDNPEMQRVSALIMIMPGAESAPHSTVEASSISSIIQNGAREDIMYRQAVVNTFFSESHSALGNAVAADLITSDTLRDDMFSQSVVLNSLAESRVARVSGFADRQAQADFGLKMAPAAPV